MLARIQLGLPFDVYREWGIGLCPIQLQREGYRIVVHPPQQASGNSTKYTLASIADVDRYADGLIPATTVLLANNITFNEYSVYKCNILTIDFFKDVFVRTGQPDIYRSLQLIDDGDPSAKLIFEVANDVLSKLRTVSRGYEIKMLDAYNTFMRIDYLYDDGSILPKEDGKLRFKFGGQLSGHFIPVNEDVWELVKTLPVDFTVHTWDTLLLDAQGLLPDIGPAIAVANVALEIFIPWALNELQSATPIAKPEIWKWIFDRGDHYQEPSVDDRYDTLLNFFTGKSLKENESLWEGYKHLRRARNSFSHEGVPIVGTRCVTSQQAADLVKNARAIVQWVEALLPESSRRPAMPKSLEMPFRITKRVGFDEGMLSTETRFSALTTDYEYFDHSMNYNTISYVHSSLDGVVIV